MSTRAFGARVKRNIDPKLLKGEGSFIDDLDCLVSYMRLSFEVHLPEQR